MLPWTHLHAQAESQAQAHVGAQQAQQSRDIGQSMRPMEARTALTEGAALEENARAPAAATDF